MDREVRQNMTHASNLISAAMTHKIDGFLSFCPPDRWVFQPFHLSLFVQIEQAARHDEVIIFTSLMRDGSGPLMTSFMTTLLIENAHGTSVGGLNVASGVLSVSYYLQTSIKDMKAKTFLQLLFNFAEIVSWSSRDLLDQLDPACSAIEEDGLPPQLSLARR